MVFEPAEQEPEEYDPEADLHDPDADSLTIPAVDVPAVEGTPEVDIDVPAVEVDAADVPADVRKNFWLLVGTVKVGMLAVAIGTVLFAFGYDRTLSVAMVAAGLALFALAGRRYRVLRSHVDSVHDEFDDLDQSDAHDEPTDSHP